LFVGSHISFQGDEANRFKKRLRGFLNPKISLK